MCERIDKLVDMLHKTPPNYTEEYQDILVNIRNELAKIPKNLENIICCDSNVGRGDRIFYDIENIKEIPYSSCKKYFSLVKTFLENDLYSIRPRYEVEYNPMYKQLCVGCFITDGTNIILLKNNTGRLKGQTCLIQGHVNFNQNTYIQNQIEFLHENMVREFNEEIHIPSEYTYMRIPLMPSYIINTTGSFSAIEHIGIVYRITVDNCEELFSYMESNEGNKHIPVIHKLSDVLYDVDNLGVWSKLLIKNILTKIL